MENLPSFFSEEIYFPYYASQKTNPPSALENSVFFVLLSCLHANIFGKIVNNKSCQLFSQSTGRNAIDLYR